MEFFKIFFTPCIAVLWRILFVLEALNNIPVHQLVYNCNLLCSYLPILKVPIQAHSHLFGLGGK